MGSDADGFLGFVFGIIIGFILIGPIGGCIVGDNYRKQAIERGYAEHDSKTGEWRWKEPAPK